MHPSPENLSFLLELVPSFLGMLCSQRPLSRSTVLLILLSIKCSFLDCVSSLQERLLSDRQSMRTPAEPYLPYRRISWPGYFYLANKGLFSLIIHKHTGEKESPISWLPALRSSLTHSASVSHVEFSLTSRKNVAWRCARQSVLNKG